MVLGWLRRVRGRWWRWRIGRCPTWVLGPQFRRSRSRIELDITWACNLRCFNCNRSCEQAPTGIGMTCAQVETFVAESLERGQRWEQIRILGGEPALHPELQPILAALLRYQRAVGGVRLVLATNGHGDNVRAALRQIPVGIEVENTDKTGQVQPFLSFNVAPVDLPAYDHADYSNGCFVTEQCGIGLTPYGYYQCAVAGGIDRIFGLGLARDTLPADEDGLDDQLEQLCRLCGAFKRDVEQPLGRPVQSPTWRSAYAAHRDAPVVLARYGSDDEHP